MMTQREGLDAVEKIVIEAEQELAANTSTPARILLTLVLKIARLLIAAGREDL